MGGILLALVLVAPPAPVPGQEVEVRVATAGTVVGLAADVTVAAKVEGDVVALAGDVVLVPGAWITGDVVALGGRVLGEGQIDGRAVALAGWGVHGSFSSTSWGTGWGLRLMWLGVWVVAANVLLLVAPRTVRRSGEVLGRSPVRTLLMGCAALAGCLALLVVGLALSSTVLGVPLFVAAMLVLVAVKWLGVVGAAWRLGRWLAPRLPLVLRPEIPRTVVSQLLLCLASQLPILGPLAWTTVNVMAIGAVAVVVLQRRPVLAAVAVPGVR